MGTASNKGMMTQARVESSNVVPSMVIVNALPSNTTKSNSDREGSKCDANSFRVELDEEIVAALGRR